MHTIRLQFLLIIVLFHIFPVTVVHAGSVHLYIAASMTDLFRELISDYSKANPGTRFLPNFASSGSLAKQIEQGAPADLYVSANQKWMQYLESKEMIVPSTTRMFAFNKLVFVGENIRHPASLDSLLSLQRIALGNPISVPAGQYAKQAMESRGIYSKLRQGKKIVFAKDVRQALLYADRREVDGAFVYATDAPLSPNVKILFTVPQGLYDRISYPVALTEKGAKNMQSKAFYSYLKSAQAQAVLEKKGFISLKPAL